MDIDIIANCKRRFKELIVESLDSFCPENKNDRRFVFEVITVSSLAVTTLVAGDTYLLRYQQQIRE